MGKQSVFVAISFLIVAAFSCRKPDETPINPQGVLTAGIVDDSLGFSVGVTSNFSDYIVHDGADNRSFSTPCTIPSGTSASNANRYCFIEVMEEDLYFRGVSMVFNVPTTMCTYVRVSPFSFFQYPTGQGPDNITYYVDGDGRYGLDTSPAPKTGIVDQIGAVQSYNGFGTLSTTSLAQVIGGKPKCVFDSTSDDSAGAKGKNCCFGKYSQTIYKWDAKASPTPDYIMTTSGSNSWGGSLTGCIAGPAYDTMELTDSGVFRPREYYTAGTGLSASLSFDAPINKKQSTNLYLANYLTLPIVAGTPFYPATLPEMTVLPTPYYTFSCLDAASETIAKYRVIVRSWTTKAEFLKRGDGNSAYGSFSDIAINPSHQYESGSFGTIDFARNNDRYGWDDLYSLTFPNNFIKDNL